MKEQISISIIVPVYQAEFFLKESVDSILAQTFEDFELILVNDGSPDRSGVICDELALKDKRIRVIHKTNEGQSSARNAGIDASKGKYIGFMDNDDFLYPDMCERLFKNAEKYQTDISAGSYIVKDEKGQFSHDKHTSVTHIYNNAQGVEAYLSRELMDIYVWTKIYRKDFLDKYCIRFENGRSDEDILFNFQAFCMAQSIVMTDIPVYIYFERKNSTCRTFYTRNIHRYLEDTCYRIRKIENVIAQQYPCFLYLARRQSIRACVRMIFVLTRFEINDSKEFYLWIKKYIYKNARQVIRDRKYWGMSFFGCLLAIYSPSYMYFYFKKWKHIKSEL